MGLRRRYSNRREGGALSEDMDLFDLTAPFGGCKMSGSGRERGTGGFDVGATGFVGSAIVKEALERGHEVTAIVRHPEKLQPHVKLHS